jgi:hypothetical protein
MSTVRQRRALSFAGRLALAVCAIPLLAPTCGDPGEGPKVFARGSLIIPMDVCYQRQTDGTGVAYAPKACPQAADAGDVIRAYGLVYQLIRNDIAVYWVIDDDKSAIDAVDLTVQYAGGFPVLHYDWSPEDPPPASPPTAQHAIDYRGGPFVVDGSDYARAAAVLQRFRSTFQNVNVHVANVAFQGYAKRTMAGGWSAGGAVAPKVALLDIGSTSNVSSGYAKNSEPIIRGYLARAGLDFAGAGGVATDTGHGQIYDRLGMADLQPSVPGDWTTTNLAKYGYQILWVPHWFAPGSCADASSQSRCTASLYPVEQREQALVTVGAFAAAGKDVFAECAGLGSFEGVASGSTGWSTSYGDGDASTHFHVTNGLAINKSVGSADYDESSASSPLLQLGDYPFIPRSGAIQNFKPATGRSPASTYQPGGGTSEVKRLVTDVSDPTWDYFTYRPPGSGRGTTVYLGGHVYSGYSDTLASDGSLVVDSSSFAIGGTRLVLNTLFNLGATCTASGVSCNTGLPGICSQGTIQCQDGQPKCVQTVFPASAEICNGLDDDCDWEVDEDLQDECYDPGLGDPTRNVGLCRSGVSSCVQGADGSYAMSACVGQVLPGDEACNALDDDCDGSVDEDITLACYEGPSSSIDPATGKPRPVCQEGARTCSLGSWGACEGQTLPQPENCFEGSLAVDDDCNGLVNDGCQCTDGQTRACYTGPAGTLGVGGICKSGLQTCTSGAWSACEGCPEGTSSDACQITPKPEVCGNDVDENCDGLAPACPECTAASEPLVCYPGDPADLAHPDAQCEAGTQACVDEHWGACLGYTGPATIELCDAVDNDCDGTVDEGAICPADFVCLAGVCAPDSCGVEIPPPEGYVCDPPPSEGGTGDADGTLAVGACGTDLDGCDPGVTCRYGQCVPPCTEGQCAAGSTCGGGACIAGGCFATGCPAGELCREGACVADPCLGALCPTGTFCRGGDCVQACTFVACPAGQKCGVDGFCEPDACAGVTCPPGQRCAEGICRVDPCTSRACAAGQVCAADASGQAICLDDPCAGITCPAGACSGGQCYATSLLSGGGAPAPEAEGGCGCGSGGAAALPALLALLAAPLARRRRRGGGLALLVAAAALLAAACQEEEEFDPAACQETCGEQRCVDLATDEAHCQVCGNPCGTGQQCVDRECGPTSAVAPYVAALSPTSGPPGATAPVRVQVSGERFAAGAKVRLGAGSSAREFPAAVADARTLAADLDLSAVAEGSYALRVVNADRVISNAKTFLVTIPTPVVTDVAPAAVVAGTGEQVLVSGTGFLDASECRLGSAATPEVVLASALEGTGLRCTIDPALDPGAYGLRIVNPGNLGSSPPTPFTITSGTATLAEVSPTSGPEGASVTITVTGDGFDGTSRVLFDGCQGPSDPPVPECQPPAEPPIVGTTFVSATTLVAALVLSECAEADGVCEHAISVRNGTGAPTAPVGFLVQADPPAVSTFSTTPAPPYQGDASVQLSFTGTNFPGGALVQVQPPGGAFGGVPVTPGTATSTTVTGTISLAGEPEGAYYARLDFGGGALSSAWPFRVLSNQPILRDMLSDPDPDRSGPQGSVKTALTLQATNLRPPYGDIRAIVRGPGIPADAPEVLDPADPADTTADLVVSGFSLVGRGTGNYAVTVRNPGGALESNALTFVVTPGPPKVFSVCRLEGTACATTNPDSAVQQSTPVPVRITGENFARPDASGNGSAVMVTSSFMPGWPDPCPPSPDVPPFQPVPGTVEVVSAAEVVVQLDTLSALALEGGTTYYVAVWNPGGPQKSNTCATLPADLPPFTVFP